MKYLSLLISALFFVACSENQKQQSLTEKIENSHQKGKFLNHKAIQFDFLLKFGGNERMNATVTVLTNSSKAKIEMKNGNKIIYDHDQIYYTPEMNDPKSIRFNAYTWTYFFLLPYKLSDPGTIISKYEQNNMQDANYITRKLTFESGTGDAPDDWYILYTNEESHLLEIAAYIVTYNKTQQEAEEDPHAIVYNNYQIIDNIPLAHDWVFYAWREMEGLTKKLGEASLSNFKFIEPNDEFFQPPGNFIKG